MERRNLGRTGMSVSPLCLGAMMFGGMGNTDHDDSIRIIHRALDAGINFIDTADVYSRGESEEIVGKALKDRRDDVVLATKVHGPMGDDPNQQGISRRWIVQEVENSLRRLQTDRIDLYQIHRPRPEVDIDETLGALTDLQRQGKIINIGSSTFQGSQIVEAQWAAERRGHARFMCEQPPYSLLVRAIETEVLPVCERYGMGVIPWSPLAGGFLSGRYRKGGEQMKSQPRSRSCRRTSTWTCRRTSARWTRSRSSSVLAEEAGMTLIELSLAFVINHPAVTVGDHRAADDGAPRVPAHVRRREAHRRRARPDRRDRPARPGPSTRPTTAGRTTPGSSRPRAAAAVDIRPTRDGATSRLPPWPPDAVGAMEALVTPAKDCGAWRDAIDPRVEARLHGAIDTLAEFPVLDGTVLRILALCDDPDATTAEIVAAIEHDASFAVNLLRYANSAALARPVRAKSVRQAVMLVGRRTLRRLSLEAATYRFLERAPGNGGAVRGQMHVHAIAVAVDRRRRRRRRPRARRGRARRGPPARHRQARPAAGLRRGRHATRSPRSTSPARSRGPARARAAGRRPRAWPARCSPSAGACPAEVTEAIALHHGGPNGLVVPSREAACVQVANAGRRPARRGRDRPGPARPRDGAHRPHR